MNITNLCLPGHSLDITYYFLACYVISLIQGKTWCGCHICSCTIQHYISALSSLYSACNLVNPCHISQGRIKTPLQTLCSFACLDNKHHTIHNSLICLHMDNVYNEHLDLSHSAITDWIILGCYTGFWKSEWCKFFQKIEHISDDPFLVITCLCCLQIWLSWIW